VNLPRDFLSSLINIKGFDKEAFEKIHASGEQVTSIRINPAKPISQFPIPKFRDKISQSKIPWTEWGYYLDPRPSFTFDPLFHAGCYYVQEASSMFLGQALKQTADLSKPLRILDLAAAPGGKSTHIQSLISKESLLVSNEVIRSRANVLQDNIIKWGCENVVVTSNDPKDFEKLENYFDVIVLDAPCSGSGLFRRDAEAIGEWSPNNVQLCSQRQQRILADVWPALKKDGVLVYSTCSYSKQEDEDILDWLINRFAVTGQQLAVKADWNIVEVKTGEGAFGYRFWPDKIKGEGFFIACFKKTGGADDFPIRLKNKLVRLNKKEIELVHKWVKPGSQQFIKQNEIIYALPGELVDDINLLLQKLKVNYFAVRLGELIHEKFIPDHALAMSKLISGDVESIEVDRDDAIRYLQKKELNIAGLSKGWKRVSYGGFSLGWVNVLHNRINNYYPKALRILRDV
jgi:16S rRNA C967 or C1407 C5-methylase (RsmB/RsmF family)/NOL1/NOP2/fmu family ribosome biogenesis protein